MLGNLQYKRLYFNLGSFGNHLDWFSWEGKTIIRVYDIKIYPYKSSVKRLNNQSNVNSKIVCFLLVGVFQTTWSMAHKGPEHEQEINTNEVGRKIVTPLKISPNTLFIFLLSRLE